MLESFVIETKTVVETLSGYKPQPEPFITLAQPEG
jgi:hypothetical protein